MAQETNNLESNYWHIDGSRQQQWNWYNYFYHNNNYSYIPALEGTYIYYAGNAATGANPTQTGLTEGYTDNTGANSFGYKTHSGSAYFNQFIRFYKSLIKPRI